MPWPGVVPRALAADYDGTIAVSGRVADQTLEALGRFRAGRRRVVIVTGRRLPHLLAAFTGVEVCDRVVAENGALLYCPADGTQRRLGATPPPALVAELGRRGVDPLHRGRVVLATEGVHRAAVAAAIRHLRLHHQVILNKGALMVLPPGVDKATGLAVALRELGVPFAETIGVGDAENDHAFLEACGTSVAVADAVPELKQRVDLVTSEAAGAGVVELIDRLAAEDVSGSRAGPG